MPELFYAFMEHRPELQRQCVEFDKIVCSEQFFQQLMNWIIHDVRNLSGVPKTVVHRTLEVPPVKRVMA